MKLNLLQKIGIILGTLLCIAILVDVLTTEPISKTNTISVKGHFSYIEKNITKGNTSYKLYIQETQNYYVIAADWSECFAYTNFQYEVKAGQPIEIHVKNEGSLLSLRKPFIVSILTNGRDYLDPNCVNQNINSEKVTVPLIFGFLLLILIAIFFIKRDRRIKR